MYRGEESRERTRTRQRPCARTLLIGPMPHTPQAQPVLVARRCLLRVGLSPFSATAMHVQPVPLSGGLARHSTKLKPFTFKAYI